jgi:hypothetical protein
MGEGDLPEFRLRYSDDADDRPIEASKITWADGLLRFAEAGLTALAPPPPRVVHLATAPR